MSASSTSRCGSRSSPRSANTPCGTYVRTRLDWAIEHALCVWWLMSGWEPEDHVAICGAYLRANDSPAGTIETHGE
jgi:hypothetical protein